MSPKVAAISVSVSRRSRLSLEKMGEICYPRKPLSGQGKFGASVGSTLVGVPAGADVPAGS